MMSIYLIFILLITTQQQCDSPVLDDTNYPSLDFSMILRKPVVIFVLYQIILGTVSFCSYLSKRDSCCTSDTFPYQLEVYQDFLNELDRRNFEVVYRYNDWMVSTLENKDQIIEVATLINQLYDQVESQQQLLDKTLKEIDRDIEKNRNNTNFTNASPFPLPPKLEKYRSNINKFYQATKDQYDNKSEPYLNDLKDFSAFDNSSFYNYKLNDKERKGGRFDITALKKNFDIIQIQMRKYVKAASQCFPSLLKHFAGLRCLTCDLDNAQVFMMDEGQLYFNAKESVCEELEVDCYDYVDIMDQMNEIVHMFVLSETSKAYVGNMVSDVNGDYNIQDIIKLVMLFQESTTEALSTVIFYDRPANCSSKAKCPYLCQNWPTSKSVNLDAIFQDNLYYTSYTSTDYYQINVTQIVDEIKNQTTSNHTQTKSTATGYAPKYSVGGRRLLLPSYEQNFSVIFQGNNSRDSIKIGQLTDINFDYDGSCGINIFNLSGKATKFGNYKASISRNIQPTDPNKQLYGMFVSGLILCNILL